MSNQQQSQTKTGEKGHDSEGTEGADMSGAQSGCPWPQPQPEIPREALALSHCDADLIVNSAGLSALIACLLCAPIRVV